MKELHFSQKINNMKEIFWFKWLCQKPERGGPFFFVISTEISKQTYLFSIKSLYNSVVAKSALQIFQRN